MASLGKLEEFDSRYTERSAVLNTHENQNNPHKAKTFVFQGYTFDFSLQNSSFSYEVIFDNSDDPLVFTEMLNFKKPFSQNVNKELIDSIMKRVHLMLGISYFKMYFPKEILVSYGINEQESDFWNILYQNGLGEYMVTNNLSYNDFPKFLGSETIQAKPLSVKVTDRVLAGIGGGKDSIVAVELLKQAEFETAGYVVESGTSSQIVCEVINIAGLDTYTIHRVLDEKVFNTQDVYNGHIPISAVFAFVGMLSCALYDYRYLALSNGQTSNFGSTVYEERSMNHAWSKSQEFEEQLTAFFRKHVSPSFQYFSPVRPFYELRIVKEFSKLPQYFTSFSSCNRSFKIYKERSYSKWCYECDKCVYMFIVLSAFLNEEDLIKIFGKNLYNEKKLLPTFKKVLGLDGDKPFDCVGEFGETGVAFKNAARHFANSIIIKELEGLVIVTDEDEKRYIKTYPSPTTPTPFVFLGMYTCAIVGYGKTGKSSQRYINEKFPNLKLSSLDQSYDENYLDLLDDYDIAIKTPGMQKEKISIQYTTAANLFFAEMEKKRISVVGVTGTAGKSATTSLITHILNTNGISAVAIGNIGNPELDAIEQVADGAVPVIELSSYQLDDIHYSPHMAVVLNLLSDHMDYHRSIEAYHDAKKNIIRFQKTNDYFVFNDSDPKVAAWVNDVPGESLPFVNEPVQLSIPVENVKAAITVSKLFDVSDSDIQSALHSFQGLPHRMQYIGEFQNIHFYDDARSSTPESTTLAIKTVTNVQTIFLGGLDRGYDFTDLRKAIKRSPIENIVLFPDTGKKIIEGLKGYTILETSSMQEAVAFAFERTVAGMSCLLSTASPSYTIWKNFEEKGGEYQQAVKNYE